MAETHLETVIELQERGILLVEDGNHGESRPRPEDFADHGVAFIRAADMDNGRVLFDSASKINDRALRRITKGIGAPGDVLLSHKGTVGKVALAPMDAPPFVCSPQTTFWRSLNTDVLDRKYLFALLRSPSFQRELVTRQGETDMAPYVSLTTQRTLTVPLPHIEAQRRVARVLGPFDDKIELNVHMNKTLEAMARAIFKHWFVDFEFPTGGKSYKSSGGELVYNEQFGKKLPKGWSVEDLGDALRNLEAGSRPKGGIGAYAEGVPSVGAENILGLGKYDYSKTRFVPESFFNRLKTGVVRSGDVVLYKDGAELGRKSLFMNGFPFQKCCVNEHVFILRSDDRVSSLYLFFWLDQGWVTEGIRNLNANSAQPGINRDGVNSLKILIPPRDVIGRFDHLVGPIVSRILSNALEDRILAETRDRLLPKLMSGKIRVPAEVR